MSKSSSPASEAKRIAKRIARAGVCSRRDAERLIEAGKVVVNGKVLKSPALNVVDTDEIIVKGKPLPKGEPVRLWRYHKPRGRVTSHRDPQGRPTVFEALPDHLPRVISVGRLDFNTEGLMLLTTDGDLARHLELPSTGWRRRYRVRAFGKVTQAELDGLKKGLVIGGVRYGAIDAVLAREGNNPWINLALCEGKNREVRRVMEHLGLKVSRLIRVSYGPFQLNDLASGAVEEVKRRVLAEQLGQKQARRFSLGPQSQLARATGSAGEREVTKQKKPVRTRNRSRKSSSGRAGRPGR